MRQTLRDLAEKLGCHLLGDSSITVTGVSSLHSTTSENLVFVEDRIDLVVELAGGIEIVAEGLLDDD